MIRSAAAADLPHLRAIARRAKSHWGGDPDTIERWIETSDFTPMLLESRRVDVVVDDDGRIVAWCSLEPRGGVWWLDDLWVDPPSMGRGFGRALFLHAAAVAREGGAERLEWESDPNAVRFYERMGGAHVGESPGHPLFGRTLPVMGIALVGHPGS